MVTVAVMAEFPTISHPTLSAFPIVLHLVERGPGYERKGKYGIRNPSQELKQQVIDHFTHKREMPLDQIPEDWILIRETMEVSGRSAFNST